MSPGPIKILLQTTIEPRQDDWAVFRFGSLAALLGEATDRHGHQQYQVVMRDRSPPGMADPVLSAIDRSKFDQLWLFAVDTGDGLTHQECDAISRFRRAGGGLLVTRDHMDLGSSICGLAGVGSAHYFHSRSVHPDAALRCRDDTYTTDISWPNFHSGANGDYQIIQPIDPVHPLLQDVAPTKRRLCFLPAHPHEGGIRLPEGEDARIIAVGHSKVTGREFNIAVAFGCGPHGGRAVAQSTFHHFADYNWDIRAGCPSFVSELPGDSFSQNRQAIADTRRYVLNIAAWLGRRRTTPKPDRGAVSR